MYEALNEVIGNLELNQIRAAHGRAEDFARDKNYREQYDLCVSRAVALVNFIRILSAI